MKVTTILDIAFGSLGVVLAFVLITVYVLVWA